MTQVISRQVYLTSFPRHVRKESVVSAHCNYESIKNTLMQTSSPIFFFALNIKDNYRSFLEGKQRTAEHVRRDIKNYPFYSHIKVNTPRPQLDHLRLILPIPSFLHRVLTFIIVISCSTLCILKCVDSSKWLYSEYEKD